MVLLSKKEMRFLVIGLGSAGQRHARVIRNIFPDASLDAFVKGRRVGLISRDLNSINQEISPIHHYKLKEITTFPEATDFYDLAVIASPIASHREYFQKLLGCSRRILIEKPIAKTLDEAQLISRAAIDSGKPTLVGYQHFFNPISKWIREICRDRKSPNAIEIHFNEYLRDMNTFRNMNSHHLASKEGGGVLLALSHEIDLLLQVWKGNLMSLQGESFFSNEFPGVFEKVRLCNSTESLGLGQTQIEICLSIASGPRSRGGVITWDEEVAQWDYFAKTASLTPVGEIGSEINFQYHGDDLIENQFRFLMLKELIDDELQIRLDRAVEVLRLNDSVIARNSKN